MSETELECVRSWVQAAMSYWRKQMERVQRDHASWHAAWMNGPGSGLPASSLKWNR